jgi:pimeloyl-ACP methyl ester carboxylesterase
MQIPRTRYAPSGDLMIAYQVHGSGEHDVLLSSGPASNVETAWSLPEAARFFERIGRFARLILFDRRDTGVSDPIRDDLTLEAHVADALAVMDEVGAEQPVLLGSTVAARSMAALAAVHPRRAAGLIALAPFVRGDSLGPPYLLSVGDAVAETAESAARMIDDIVSKNWPERMVDLYAPEWAEDRERRDRLIRYVSTCFSPKQARRLLQMSISSDLSGVLPLVQAPTLALAPRDGQIVPQEAVSEFAELIPGAEYREVPGAATMIYALDVDQLADLIEEFVTGRAPAPISNRILASVLFTDLVGSTERASELGDAVWSELLERHHTQARSAVEQHGGETVKASPHARSDRDHDCSVHSRWMLRSS